MKLMVIGASKGIGRAFVKGLCRAGDTVVGVSLIRSTQLDCGQGRMRVHADAVADMFCAYLRHLGAY